MREVSAGIAERGGVDPGSPAALPALCVAIAIASFALNIPGNQLSREIEASADSFALELTDDPAGADRAAAAARPSENVGDPDPPGWAEVLFGTHPAAIDRIGAALAYERGERPD